MGSTHFLTRGIQNVSTEMSLDSLAYNFKRVLSILGFARTKRSMQLLMRISALCGWSARSKALRALLGQPDGSQTWSIRKSSRGSNTSWLRAAPMSREFFVSSHTASALTGQLPQSVQHLRFLPCLSPLTSTQYPVTSKLESGSSLGGFNQSFPIWTRPASVGRYRRHVVGRRSVARRLRVAEAL